MAASETHVTALLVLSTLATTLCGSFQVGYQVAGLSAPSILMQKFFNQSNAERRDAYLSDSAILWLWSTTISVLSIGAAIGALISGYLADLLGRKGAMMLVNVLSILAGLLMGFSYLANSYEMIIVGRLVIGVFIGASSGIVPLYLAEIAPIALRGAIVVGHQLMITVGILIVQILGLYAFMYETGWPILLSLTAVPSILQFFVLPFCPESPRWLFIKKNKESECRQILQKLRGTDQVEEEMEEIRREAEDDEKTEKVGVLTLLRLKDPNWKKPLIISIYLLFSQQFSGINAIVFYATEVYRQTGFDENLVYIATVATGLTFVVMTIVTVFVIERVGRKPLLVYPFAIMAVSLVVVTVSLGLQPAADGFKWVALFGIFIFIIAFSIGPGAVPYVVVPELWAQGPRPAAMSIAIQTLWICNFITGITFPFLQATIGAYTFAFYAVICFVSAMVVYRYVPETKGRTFEDVVATFSKERVASGSALLALKSTRHS